MKKRLLVLLLVGLLITNMTVVYAGQQDTIVSDADLEKTTTDGKNSGDATNEEVSPGENIEESEKEDTDENKENEETVETPVEDEIETTESVIRSHKLKDVSIENVKGVEQIPAKFINQLDGINLLKITTKYEDGREGFVSLLKSVDKMGTKITYEYEDIEEYEDSPEVVGDSETVENSEAAKVLKSIHRHFVIKFYEDPEYKIQEPSTDIYDPNEPVKTVEYDIEFLVTPASQIEVRNNLTLKVTEAKNWRLFQLDPKTTTKYGFTTNKVANIRVIVDDGEKFEKYDITDSFELDSEKTYTVLMVYDMSTFYENMQ